MAELDIIEDLIEETKSKLNDGYDYELQLRLNWLNSIVGRVPVEHKLHRIGILADRIKADVDIAGVIDISNLGLYLNRIQKSANEILDAIEHDR